LNFLPSGYGHREFVTGVEHLDELSREVYGVLGIPIDAVDLSAAVHRIGAAMRQDQPFLMSTPNLNFLVTSQSDGELRESLLQSDLCPVDGVPIVWISRLPAQTSSILNRVALPASERCTQGSALSRK
jgi:UDP-N-acetyl-D-mannosaminuronic acid transferase (WecB/TagA/CpsF family)